MKIGIITDVHEDLSNLQWALELLRDEQVERIVFLGDVMVLGEELESTCRMLRDHDVQGVWGNHDLGLAYEPDQWMLDRFGPLVIRYMTTLKPRLQWGECHFSHVEPWLDPHDPTQINYYEGPPDSVDKLGRIFDSGPARLFFSGHYHRWLLASPTQITDWIGERPVRLTDERYYVVIRAVCEGGCALFDTETSELVPFNRAT